MTEEQQSPIGREFRHFKGNLYRLEGFAKDSETLEEMVVAHQANSQARQMDLLMNVIKFS
jgi:hypothetical protein